jgi:hypothetical protein
MITQKDKQFLYENHSRRDQPPTKNKFYSGYNGLVCDSKWPQALMLNDLFHTLCLTVVSTLALAIGNSISMYLISTKWACRVLLVNREYLFLHGTWSYLRISWGFVLSYTRFCIWFLDYDYTTTITVKNKRKLVLIVMNVLLWFDTDHWYLWR